ncbi:lipase family protein [Rhizobium leguminosarum]
MAQPFPFDEALGYINSSDWTNSSFDLKKAYICSLLSELTYRRIPEFELKDANRVSVIPCLAYQDAVREGRDLQFDETIRSADIGRYFVFVQRYAIVVGIQTPKVTFVAIRGTKYLYDWLVNLHAAHYSFDIGAGKVRFHRGFFRATYACLGPLLRNLSDLHHGNSQRTPLVITGHSLGGAMAAILSALWEQGPYGETYHPRGRFGVELPVASCYTLGMPRYGDMRAVTSFVEPYHLYNEADIVPTVPPRWLGFDNCYNEFMLDGTSIENVQGREIRNFASWIGSLFSGKGIREHSIELYRDRIKSSI